MVEQVTDTGVAYDPVVEAQITKANEDHAKALSRAAQTQKYIDARAAVIGEAPVPLHAQAREAFKQQILPSESKDPQNRALMADAIDSIFHGLGELAKHGLSYTLIRHDPEAVRPVEWPKMMYDSGGRGWTFASQAELDATAKANPDMVWFDHPTDRTDSAAAKKTAAAKTAADKKAADDKAAAAAAAAKK